MKKNYLIFYICIVIFGCNSSPKTNIENKKSDKKEAKKMIYQKFFSEYDAIEHYVINFKN